MTPQARSMLDQVKTFILVGLLTVLVWMLAEAESLRIDRLRAEIAFRGDAETGRLVRIEPGQEFAGYVHIRVEGPTRRVDDLASTLRHRLLLEPGMDGIPLDPGRHTLNLLEVLRSHTSVRDRRVTITGVDPPTLTITVQNLATRELPVRLQLPPGQVLEGAAEMTPPTVRVRMPESALERLREGAQAIARPDPDVLRALPEGRRHNLSNVQVELPEELRGIDGVRPSPSQVQVALTLRSRTAAVVLPTVPVHLRLPPEEAALWDIHIPQDARVLTDVTVTGPSEAIDQIRDGRVRPIAYISLTFEELERAAAAGQPIQAPVVFQDMPSLLNFEPRQRTIPVTVRRRANGVSPVDMVAP
jgi:hypothetical protein